LSTTCIDFGYSLSDEWRYVALLGFHNKVTCVNLLGHGDAWASEKKFWTPDKHTEAQVAKENSPAVFFGVTMAA
jgi:hypothetical protein